MKTCNICRRAMEKSAFGSNKSSKDSKQNACRECVNRRQREWYSVNTEVHKARVKRYRQRRPAVKKASDANRRSSGERLTVKEVEAVLNYYGNQCLACGSAGSLTIDHVIPLSKGGPNELGNLQVLCGRCNSSKGAKSHDHRDAERGVLVEVL